MSTYKDNIVERIGGKTQFTYVIMQYCERIRDDSSLKGLFAHLTLNGLMEFQSELLDAAFLDVSIQETETFVGRLAVKYQTLWKIVHEGHFEQLKVLFVMALQECWVEGDLIHSAETHFDTLRPLFQPNDKLSNKIPSPTVRTSKSSLHHLNSPAAGGVTGHQRTS